MKRLLILSGKGGTGKTTVAGAFINLASAKAFADCDVDAPNLHLIMDQKIEPEKTDYFGMGKAKIDLEKCISCGLCEKNCHFNAIALNNACYEVDEFSCEGCGVCEAICPASAIELCPAVAGELMLYKDDNVFSTAQLKMGSGTSGKLVTEVKKQLNSAVAELAIIDGSPGIGCPVIASLSGVDMVLIVAEPSLSGISDMERIIRTAQKFGVRTVICVNKYDTNVENTIKIKKFCSDKGLPFVGRIPFDSNVMTALNKGKSIADVDCAASRAIKSVYEKTLNILNKRKNIMIIKTLVENTSVIDECKSEHGLSLYIETKTHKLLFDLGKSNLFLENAKKLDVDISEIDMVIISHGHFDHGGGLGAFLKVNSKAKIYMHTKAFEKHYSLRENGVTAYIGLDEKLEDNERIIYVEDYFKIDDELELFSNVRSNELPSLSNKVLLMESGDKIVEDTFDHELNLIIAESQMTVLIAGCAHRGIVNIANHAIGLKKRPIDYVIGGFHLFNPNTKMSESPDLIEQIGKRLKESSSKYYTCHCTGLEAYETLKTVMKENIKYLATGSIVVL